jgi:hypothetical protein
MEFKGPKRYKPSFAGQPSPSRDEMWRGEMGFDGGNQIYKRVCTNQI